MVKLAVKIVLQEPMLLITDRTIVLHVKQVMFEASFKVMFSQLSVILFTKGTLSHWCTGNTSHDALGQVTPSSFQELPAWKVLPEMNSPQNNN